MLVLTTAPTDGSLAKVIVTLAASEIDALLAGGAERFPVTIGDVTHDVEMIAASHEPPPGPKPNIRLRVADGALGGARLGSVTVFFDGVPFQLVLMCSDPPPTGPVKVAPGLTYERVDARDNRRASGSAPQPGARPAGQQPADELPFAQRLAIAAFFGALIAGVGYLRDDPLYYLAALVAVIAGTFTRSSPQRRG